MPQGCGMEAYRDVFTASFRKVVGTGFAPRKAIPVKSFLFDSRD